MKKYILTFCLIFTIGFQVKAQNSSKLYFVFLNSKSDKVELTKDSVEKLQKAHLDNIARLHKAGKIIAAGPFEGGGGLFVFKTASLEETWELLNTDPGIKAKRWNLEVFPLKFKYGKIGTIPENYKMKTYCFVRYNNKLKSKVSNAGRRNFFKNAENKLLVCGCFGKKTGGFMVIQTEDTEEAFKIARQDPLLQSHLYDFWVKKLWIAEGTFVSNK